MQPTEIAKILQERKNVNSFSLDPETRQRLGRDGLSEAIRRRWVIPESDHLTVNSVPTFYSEICRLAEEAQANQVGQQVTVVDGGKSYTGVVQAVKPGGKFVVSFPNNARPAAIKAEYAVEELNFDASDKSKPGSTDSKPVPAAPSGAPPAPGVSK